MSFLRPAGEVDGITGIFHLIMLPWLGLLVAIVYGWKMPGVCISPQPLGFTSSTQIVTITRNITTITLLNICFLLYAKHFMYFVQL